MNIMEIIYNSRIELYYFIIFFTLYSFFGWIIEFVFRSIKNKRFINPGFLYGIFLPIYGISACSIIVLRFIIQEQNIILQIFIYSIVLTVIEYLVGVISEKMFGLILWDYSNKKFNIKGKVCLKFFIVWAAMATVFIFFIHPLVNNFIIKMNERTLGILSISSVIYFTTDFTFSIFSLNTFKERLSYLYSEYMVLNNKEIENIFDSFKRLLNAFPNLNKYLYNNISNGIKKRVDKIQGTINKKLFDIISERKPAEKEYYDIVQDILDNIEFQNLKNFYHHNSSIYEHAAEVSYLSYRISKYFKLDYSSAARGGLLHDFFLYDWRNHDEPDLEKDKFHGLMHPKIALKNSEKYFKLNNIERDIILKHMWPLTLFPPLYKESFVVTFVDKYTASREFFEEFTKKGK